MHNSDTGKLASLALVFLASCLLSSCASRGIYGRYRSSSGLASEEIELRRDGTFTYRSFFDVGGETTDDGTWHFEDAQRQLVVAESSTPEPVGTVRTLPLTGEQIVVRVRASAELALSGVKVVISCGSEQKARLTDDSGTAVFPLCALSHVEADLPGFLSVSQPLTATENLEILLPIATQRTRLGRGLWLISGGRLYQLESEPLLKTARDDAPN